MNKLYLYDMSSGHPEGMYLTDHELSDEERSCNPADEAGKLIGTIKDFSELAGILKERSITKGSEDYSRIQAQYRSLTAKVNGAGSGNEYWENGRLYVRSIKNCQCRRKFGEEYDLHCRIFQRGDHSYRYVPKNAYLTRDGKKLWLSEKAEGTIRDTVRCFDDFVMKAKKRYTRISVSELKLDIYLGRFKAGRFPMVLVSGNEPQKTMISCSSTLENLLNEIRNCALHEDRDVYSELFESKHETIQKNPLYIAAVKRKDKELQKRLKLYYRIATKEDCSWLEKLLGLRVLANLSEEYDRMYYVDSDTVDIALLNRSGYTIVHRPYFAMIDSTHSVWALNPHTKKGVDAAKNDTVSIPFSEYLQLFEEEGE